MKGKYTINKILKNSRNIQMWDIKMAGTGIMAGICTSPYLVEKVRDSPYPYPYSFNTGIPRQNGNEFGQYPRGRVYLPSLLMYSPTQLDFWPRPTYLDLQPRLTRPLASTYLTFGSDWPLARAGLAWARLARPLTRTKLTQPLA